MIVAAALGKLHVVKAVVESGQDLAAHRRRDVPAEPDDHWTADTAHMQNDVLSDALYAAARNGHTEVVAFLAERGARIDAKGVFGAPALHWAAINGHQSTVELLLACGADATIHDARFNTTAEVWAREGGHPAVADLIGRASRR
jgi:ankyrin repeat protein